MRWASNRIYRNHDVVFTCYCRRSAVTILPMRWLKLGPTKLVSRRPVQNNAQPVKSEPVRQKTAYYTSQVSCATDASVPPSKGLQLPHVAWGTPDRLRQSSDRQKYIHRRWAFRYPTGHSQRQLQDAETLLFSLTTSQPPGAQWTR